MEKMDLVNKELLGKIDEITKEKIQLDFLNDGCREILKNAIQSDELIEKYNKNSFYELFKSVTKKGGSYVLCDYLNKDYYMTTEEDDKELILTIKSRITPYIEKITIDKTIDTGFISDYPFTIECYIDRDNKLLPYVKYFFKDNFKMYGRKIVYNNQIYNEVIFDAQYDTSGIEPRLTNAVMINGETRYRYLYENIYSNNILRNIVISNDDYISLCIEIDDYKEMHFYLIVDNDNENRTEFNIIDVVKALFYSKKKSESIDTKIDKEEQKIEEPIGDYSNIFKYVKFEDFNLSSDLEEYKLKYSDLFKKLCKDDNIEIRYSADSILKNLLEVVYMELYSKINNDYVCLNNIGEYSLRISHYSIRVELSDVSDNIDSSLFKGRSFVNCNYENIRYSLLEENEQLYINLVKSLFLISKSNNKMNIFISNKRVF